MWKTSRWRIVRLRSNFNVFGCILVFWHVTFKITNHRTWISVLIVRHQAHFSDAISFANGILGSNTFNTFKLCVGFIYLNEYHIKIALLANFTRFYTYFTSIYEWINKPVILSHTTHQNSQINKYFLFQVRHRNTRLAFTAGIISQVVSSSLHVPFPTTHENKPRHLIMSRRWTLKFAMLQSFACF